MIVAVADTHAVIWYLHADERLSPAAKQAVEDAAATGDQIGVSAITLVEMVYLIEKGRIAAESLSRLAAALRDVASVLVELPLDLETARMMARVDAVKVPDLPDRIIAASALLLGVPVISRDEKIHHSGLQVIW
ncbi:MAG: type II toxin-antitoxin system VapC family toxin [Anaerolineae bacterium]|nr:type II toxin-antitoxin system VapC family toxin [Anaerolineae bacterium]